MIPLAKMDPTQAMSSLRAVFVRDGSNAPTIEPDTYGRQLIVRATPEQLLQIREVLKGLGEDGSGRRAAQTGTLRAFNLQGRDAETILQMTQQMMGGSAKSRIRIVTPENRGAVNGIKVPSQKTQPAPAASEPTDIPTFRTRPASNPGERASFENRPGDGIARKMALLASQESQTMVRVAPEVPDDEAGPASSTIRVAQKDEAAAPPAGSSKEPPITITILGDQLVIQSEDEAVLDQMEDYLQQSLEYLPPSNKPTIFILQSADPVETANTLVALFPTCR